MHFLRRSQILLTAHSHSATGDIRTWESFASGALVVIDEIDIPTRDPFEPGKHYWPLDPKDIQKTLGEAKALLSNAEEREKIAMAGYEHGKKYHSTRARMDYIFDEIDKRKKW